MSDVAIGQIDQLSPLEHRVLSGGVAALLPQSNCAPGTFGEAVMSLKERGLMAEEPTSFGWINYKVTRRGRDAFVSYGRPYVPMT